MSIILGCVVIIGGKTMSSIRALLNRLVAPATSITDSVDRQRAYMLSVLLFILAVAGILGSMLFLIVEPALSSQIKVIMVIGNMVYISLYVLSRTVYYRIAAWAFILGVSTFLWSGYFLDAYTVPHDALIYLVTPVLVASVVLDRRQTLIAFTFILLSLMIFPFIYPNPDYSPYNIPFFLTGIGVLTFIWVSINDRYRQQALDSEKRYRELMNANDEAIVIIDNQDGHILDLNPAFERIIGYPSEEIIGRFPTDFLIEKSKELGLQVWQQRSHFPEQFTGQRKDGSNFYIRSTMKPYRYQNTDAYVVTIIDIGQQHAAEKALRLSEERFEAIFHNTFQFIGVLDEHGHVEGLNEPAIAFGKFSLGRIINKPIWDLNWYKDEANRQLVESKIHQTMAGDFARFELDLIGHDGQTMTADVSVKPIFDDEHQVSRLIMEVRDITERKNAERKRVEIQHRYEALFNHTVDAVFLIDIPTGRPIDANERALRMLRCNIDDIIGAELTTFIVEEEHEQTTSILERLRDGDKVQSAYERKMRRKDGEIFIAEITAMLVRDAEGDPIYVQSMIRDTTERRESQQRDFELALHRERVDMLEDFIEQASHHFRTPISNIRTSVYLLPKFQGNDEKQQKYYGVLQEELIRLQKLLDDLLTVSRLQRDEEEYYISRIVMPQFIDEIRTSVESRASYNNFNWIWDNKLTHDAIVVGDTKRLTRALSNILENSMTYTPYAGSISVRCYQHNSWAVIEVEDTGIGISQDELSKIFDDFYRTPSAQEMDSTSTGLGLSITEKIIDRHKGTIRVASELREGTIVQVILPILLDWNTPPPPASFDIRLGKPQ